MQEAYLRAHRFFARFRGGDPRPWLLAIVRNTAFSLRRRDRTAALTTEFNDELHSDGGADAGPAADLDRHETVLEVRAALDALPLPFREVLVLREMQDLSYDEIARIVRAPIGTVMSRIARGRKKLEQLLAAAGKGDR